MYTKTGAFLTIIWWKNIFFLLQVQIFVQVNIKMVHFLLIFIVWCKKLINLVNVLHVLVIFLHVLVQYTVIGVHFHVWVKFHMFWYTEKIGALMNWDV